MVPLQEDERAPQQAVAEGLTRRAEHRGDGRAHVPWRILGDGHLQACVVAASALAVCGRRVAAAVAVAVAVLWHK